MAIKKNTRKKAQKPKTAKAGKPSHSGSWLKAFLVAFAIICVVRLFIYQTYAVSTSSMSATLIPGDLVLINKLSYGARTPITPLSVPFAPARTQATSPKLFLDFIRMPYFRLPGFTKIKRNDVVACNYPLETEVPVDKRILFLKRIVGLPGDTVYVKENQLFINQQKVFLGNIQNEYRVDFRSRKIPAALIEKYNLKEGSMLSQYGEYTMYLTEKNAAELAKEKTVSSVKKEPPLNYLDLSYIFPFFPKLNWSINNYGPLMIPRKGMTIKVDVNTIAVYRSVIEGFEGNKIELNNNQVLINGLPIYNYVFKNNYYFVMDDNRDNPKDSRLWGFLPESHIVGKANFILASFDPSVSKSGMKWNRILKKIE